MEHTMPCDDWNNTGSMGGSYTKDGGFRNQPAVEIRKFESGATRSSDVGKPDFEGYLSPLVIERYGEYMLKHSRLSDGSVRASDNWQKGIPQEQLVKSSYRHFMDWWMGHRGHSTRETMEDSLCAILFNASAYLHRLLIDRKYREVL